MAVTLANRFRNSLVLSSLPTYLPTSYFQRKFHPIRVRRVSATRSPLRLANSFWRELAVVHADGGTTMHYHEPSGLQERSGQTE